jgi:phage protein D
MPIGNQDHPALTMSPLDDLMEFYPRLSLLNQSSEVRVCSSDARKAGEKLEWRSEKVLLSAMGGDNIAAAIAERAFGSAVETINNCPVMSLAEAEELANARHKQNALSLITGEGVCRGRADVCSGKVVRINGVGQQFSGNYYVTATTNHYRTSGDYTTHFYFQRNAA